jgi:uncharacterized repeat protein (TIGR02543 family)
MSIARCAGYLLKFFERRRAFSILLAFSFLLQIPFSSVSYSATPSGSDFAYDKESNSSLNMIYGNTQVIPAGISDVFTVETWLKLESYGEANDWMTIASQNQGSACCTNRFWFGINVNGKNFHVGTSAAYTDSPNIELVMPLGTWAHVALTMNSTPSNNLKIYVNGTLFHETTLTRASSANVNGFAIGTNTSGGFRLDGTIDNFKVWNNVLTRDQILASRYSYGADDVSGSPSLRAFYDFDEGSGSAVNDRSGNGYNLGISNASGAVLDTYVSSNRTKAIAYNNQSATVSHSGGSTTFSNGSTISAVPTTPPQKSNFTFAGWFTAASGGTQITSGAAMPNTRDGTVTLYAQWTDAVAPVITGPSSATGATSSISISENTTSVHTFTANESVTWSKSGTDESFFSISAGGVVTITSRNFESPADSGGDNTYVFIVTATDAALNAKNQTVTVTITNVNEAPVITINSLNATHAITQAENSTSVITYTATDVDAGASLSFSLSGADAADFAINSSSGVLIFASAPDFEVPADSDVNNTYEVIVTVSDGSLNDTQTLTVTITNVNENSSIGAPTVSGTVNKGVSTTITVTSDVAGKVRFFLGGKRISNCLARSTTGSSPSFTATCAWKPPVTGSQNLTARITPTDSSFTSATSTSTAVWVTKRTNNR